MSRWLIIAGLCGLCVAPGMTRAAEPLVLAELFTSQSCSSCPPADAVLGDLAKRPGVLALSFHVDYWNSLGWKDPFSAHWATSRQRHYAEILGSEIYTPQLVIDGRVEAVGSDRGRIESLLQARHGAAAASTIREVGGQFAIQIDAVPAAGATPAADILLVTFNARHDMSIGGGENDGRRLSTYNDVRSLRSIGTWHGDAVTLTPSRDDTERGERAAVIVQSADGMVWALAATSADAS